MSTIASDVESIRYRQYQIYSKVNRNKTFRGVFIVVHYFRLNSNTETDTVNRL